MSNLKIALLSIGFLMIPHMVFAIGCTGGMTLVKSTDHPFGDCVRARNVAPSACSTTIYKAPPGDLSPAEIEGTYLQLWLDATDPSTKCDLNTNGNQNINISPWKDKSGHGNDFLFGGQVSSTPNMYGPQLKQNLINGKPMLSFYGNTLSETNNGTIANNGAILPAISQINGVPNNNATIFIVDVPVVNTVGSLLSTGGISGHTIVNVPNNTTTSAQVTLDMDPTTSLNPIYNNVQAVLPQPTLPTNVDLWTFNTSSNSKYGTSISHNGVVISSNSNTLSAPPSGPLLIASNLWQGYIGEVIIYNTTLSDAEQEAVESYLAHKWGVALQQATVPGLLVWLDADNPLGLGSPTGTTITSWTNVNTIASPANSPSASPPGNNTPTATAGPSSGQIALNQLNGLPEVLLSSGDSTTLGQLPSIATSNAYTIFTVSTISPNTSPTAGMISCSGGFSIGYSAANTFQVVHGGSSPVTLNITNTAAIPDGVVAGNTVLSMVKYDGVTSPSTPTVQINYHVNGRDYNRIAPIPAYSGCTGNAQLALSSTGSMSPQYFAEVQIYNTALSQRQIANIEHSLKVKWGLQ